MKNASLGVFLLFLTACAFERPSNKTVIEQAVSEYMWHVLENGHMALYAPVSYKIDTVVVQSSKDTVYTVTHQYKNSINSKERGQVIVNVERLEHTFVVTNIKAKTSWE